MNSQSLPTSMISSQVLHRSRWVVLSGASLLLQPRDGKPASSNQNHPNQHPPTRTVRLQLVLGSRGMGGNDLSWEPEKEHTLRPPQWVHHSGKT